MTLSPEESNTATLEQQNNDDEDNDEDGDGDGDEDVDDMCTLSCQERYVAKRMANYPPSGVGIIRRKASVCICRKCSTLATSKQRHRAPGQQMFERLLTHERKQDRLLVPDLATEWFRKQKVFLDKVTPEEMQRAKEPLDECFPTPGYECDCRRCGCGNETTLQHSVQYLDYCQELKRRRLLLQRQRQQQRQGASVCRCNDPIRWPPKRRKDVDREQQQLDCSAQQQRFAGGVAEMKPQTDSGKTKRPSKHRRETKGQQSDEAVKDRTGGPDLGTLYPHRTCSCLRPRRRDSCACIFQADGQPLGEECLEALRGRTQSSLLRLRRKRSLREAPQRRLDPAHFRRISPEFYSLLQRYEDGMSERYPLYGLPMRYWSKATTPCCPCEEAANEDVSEEQCLGDQSLAKQLQVQQERELDRQLQLEQAQLDGVCDPDVCDCCEVLASASESASASPSPSATTTTTYIDDCDSASCPRRADNAPCSRHECEQNECNYVQCVREDECSREVCERSECLEECMEDQETAYADDTQESLNCKENNCPVQRAGGAPSQLRVTYNLDSDLKAVGIMESQSLNGGRERSKRKGILGSVAGLCKRAMQPGRHLLYSLSTLPNKPAPHERKPKEASHQSLCNEQDVRVTFFSHQPKRGNWKPLELQQPQQQWTTTQVTASGCTVQSSRQPRRRYYTRQPKSRISWQSAEPSFVQVRSFDSSQTQQTLDMPSLEVSNVTDIYGSELTASTMATDSLEEISPNASTLQSQSKISSNTGSQLTAETQLTAGSEVTQLTAFSQATAGSEATANDSQETQLTASSQATAIDSQMTQLTEDNSQVTGGIEASTDTLRPAPKVAFSKEVQQPTTFRTARSRLSYAPASDYVQLMRLVARKRAKTRQHKRCLVTFADRQSDGGRSSANPANNQRQRFRSPTARSRSVSPVTRKRRKSSKGTQFHAPDFEIDGPAYPRAQHYQRLPLPSRQIRPDAEERGVWRATDSNESVTDYSRNSKDLSIRARHYYDSNGNQGNWQRNRDYSHERASNRTSYSLSELNDGQNVQERTEAYEGLRTKRNDSQASTSGISGVSSNYPKRWPESNMPQAARLHPRSPSNDTNRHYRVQPGQLNYYAASKVEDVELTSRQSRDSIESRRRFANGSNNTSMDTVERDEERLANITRYAKRPSYSSFDKSQSRSMKSEAPSLLPMVFTRKPPVNERLLKLREAATRVPKLKVKAHHVRAHCSLRTRRPPPKRLIRVPDPYQMQLVDGQPWRQQQPALVEVASSYYQQEHLLSQQHYDRPLHIVTDQPEADQYDKDSNNDNDNGNDNDGNQSSPYNREVSSRRSRSGCDVQFLDDEQHQIEPSSSQLLPKGIRKLKRSIGQSNRRSSISIYAPSSAKKRRAKDISTPCSSACSLRGAYESQESSAYDRQSQISQTDLSWQKSSYEDIRQQDRQHATADSRDSFRQEDTGSRQESLAEQRCERYQRRPQSIKRRMGQAVSLSSASDMAMQDYGRVSRGLIVKGSNVFGNSYSSRQRYDADLPAFSESLGYPPAIRRRRCRSSNSNYAIEPPPLNANKQPQPSSILKSSSKPLNNVLKQASDVRRVNFGPQQLSHSSMDVCDTEQLSSSPSDGYSTIGTPACYTVQTGSRRPAVLRAHTVHNSAAPGQLPSNYNYIYPTPRTTTITTTTTTATSTATATAVRPMSQLGSREKVPSLFAMPSTSSHSEVFKAVRYDDDKVRSSNERLAIRAKTEEEQHMERSRLPMNSQLFTKRSDLPQTRRRPSDRIMPPSVTLVSDLDFNTHCATSRSITSEESRERGGTTTTDVPLMLTTIIDRLRHKQAINSTASRSRKPHQSASSFHSDAMAGSGYNRRYPCYPHEALGNNMVQGDNYYPRRRCCLRRLPEEPVVIEATHAGLKEQQLRQNCLPILFYGRKC